MMASSFPIYSTTTVSSQLTGSLAGNIPIIPPIFPTPSVAAANGFRPSIPPKNSRVPAGEIDRLSLSKMKITSVCTSITDITQSLPPPPLPHPQIKGISNAQARTARKSAPSSSNRGDGYSTSSSGGGGKKSISGKNNGENRDRGFPSPNEDLSLSDDATIEILQQCLPQQTPLPTPPKPQLQIQPQVQDAQEQEIQPSPENGLRLQQIELGSPVVPAPPTFSGPSIQVAGVKRPVSPVGSDIFSTGKPKRQKIATAKAAALANEPGMNADGSAIKRRKPRRSILLGLGKEKEKLWKSKEKSNGQGMFVAMMADRCGPGETNSGTAVLQRLPNLPPRYQVPVHLQRQNPQHGQHAKGDPPVGYGLTPSLFSSLPVGDLVRVGLVVPDNNSPTTNLETNNTLQTQTISTSSLPITQQTATSELEKRAQNNDRIALRGNERGRNHNTPITIDDGSSEGEEITNDTRSPSGHRGRTDIEVMNRQTKPPTIGYHHGSLGPTQVSDVFFTKCIDTSLSDDERRKLVVEIQKFIVGLVAEAKKHCWVPKASSEVGRFQPRQDSSTLEKITALLEYMCVLTSEGVFITLDEWKGSGMPKFQGRFILQDYRDAWKETSDAKKSDNVTGPSSELQTPRKLDDRIADIDITDVAGQQTVSPVGTRKTQQVAAVLNSGTTPRGNANEKAKESLADGKPKENLALVNRSLQPMGAASSSLDLLISHPPEASARNPMPPQSSPEQMPSSPSSQIQAEASVRVTATSDRIEVATPNTSSGKGKRKRFVTPSVQDFLKEWKIGQEVQSLRTSNFDIKQARNDPLMTRIVELNQEELHVRDDIDDLVVKSKLEEKNFERRIAEARMCDKAGVNGREFNSEFGIGDLANSPVNWEEFRKVTRELRDFQDNTRQTELRLADKATRIAEEKLYLIQRRKRMSQMESELDTTPSVTTSEDSTAPSSVSGSLAPRQGIPLPAEVEIRNAQPEMSVGYELLRGLIPWATQFQETPTENLSPLLTEQGLNQTKSKKKPARKRKHW